MELLTGANDIVLSSVQLNDDISFDNRVFPSSVVTLRAKLKTTYALYCQQIRLESVYSYILLKLFNKLSTGILCNFSFIELALVYAKSSLNHLLNILKTIRRILTKFWSNSYFVGFNRLSTFLTRWPHDVVFFLILFYPFLNVRYYTAGVLWYSVVRLPICHSYFAPPKRFHPFS